MRNEISETSETLVKNETSERNEIQEKRGISEIREYLVSHGKEHGLQEHMF